MNPLDLDDEFNFVDWKIEQSVNVGFEEEDDQIMDADKRSNLAKNLKQENSMCAKLQLFEFLALEK